MSSGHKRSEGIRECAEEDFEHRYKIMAIHKGINANKGDHAKETDKDPRDLSRVAN